MSGSKMFDPRKLKGSQALLSQENQPPSLEMLIIPRVAVEDLVQKPKQQETHEKNGLLRLLGLHQAVMAVDESLRSLRFPQAVFTRPGWDSWME